MNSTLRIIILGLGLGAAALWFVPPANAQNCNPWLGIKSWKGGYVLTSNGAGSAPGGPATWNQVAVANVFLNVHPTQCASQLEWGGADALSAGQMEDTQKVPNTCGPGVFTNTYQGAGTNNTPSPKLTLDLTKGTYTFSDLFFLTGVKGTNCKGSATVPPLLLSPIPPDSPWPYQQPLPATSTVLSTQATFTAQNWLGASAQWTLLLSLSDTADDNVDDPCKKPGSTVECQNQNLGEDLALVGVPFSLHYDSGRAPGRGGADISVIADSLAFGGWTLSIHHFFDPGSNTLFLGNGERRSAGQLGSPIVFNGNFLVASQDGSRVYVFNSSGQHLSTLNALTGMPRFQFSYDSSGQLITVTDANGNVSSIQRDSAEHPTAIIGPFGQRTTFTLDSNGYLSEILDPAGHATRLTHSSSGLLTTLVDPNGNAHNFEYDNEGRLISDTEPTGASQTLSRIDLTSGYQVTHTTALGRKTVYQVLSPGTGGSVQTATLPNGLTNKMSIPTSGSATDTYPDGTMYTISLGADPRWGMQAPTENVSLTKGSLTGTISSARTATLATAGDPFSLASLIDTTTVNGHVSTGTYTASTNTYVSSSAAGRTMTTVLDGTEHVLKTQVNGLAASNYSYDPHGRLSRVTQGTRATSLAYNTAGFLAGITDPAGRKNSFTYDNDGNLLSRTLPDGRAVQYSYDANGNLLSVTPPSHMPHDFLYTSTDFVADYNPPSVPGSGPLTYAYNLDQQISSITRPDGKTITFSYDSAGRISSIATAANQTNYSYSTTTGLLASNTVVGGEALAYADNGPLLTKLAWSGPVVGSVGHTYDDNFNVVSRTVNGSNAVAFKYDNDGVMTSAGSLTLSLNSTKSLLAGTALGLATDTRTYNSFGEVTAYAAAYNGVSVYNTQFTRDALGRISAKSETLGGVSTSFGYTYDTAGRLTSVSKNGTAVANYSYDSNSNRIGAATGAGTATATYDAQDRLLTYGTAIYTYTANGEIATKTTGSQVISYQYDGTGNLVGVTLPNGTQIAYVLDGKGRRVGEKTKGVLMQGFLYDGSQPVAQVNGSNQLVSQFVYATRANVPDYMVKGGVVYRIYSDHLGSPRLIVNTATGQIAERIDYDEFGNVLTDTNPGFQPFGFAGGLYDPTTKLVHFGARDYAPAIGRWLTKDPILFSGGDTNLYGYVLGDPVNLIDPDGNTTWSVNLYPCGLCPGGGISISSSDGHLSWQVEIGGGSSSIGAQIDPNGEAFTGENMSGSRVTIFGEFGGELSIPIPGLGKVTLLEGKVGFRITESPCPGKFGPVEPTGKACAGSECIGTEGHTHQLAGELPEQPKAPESHAEGEKVVGPAGKAGIIIDMNVW
jgi:RHS repeat-associated protein